MLDDETKIEFRYSRRLYPGIDVEQTRRQVRMTLRKKDEEPTSLLLKRPINNRDLRILLFHYDNPSSCFRRRSIATCDTLNGLGRRRITKSYTISIATSRLLVFSKS